MKEENNERPRETDIHLTPRPRPFLFLPQKCDLFLALAVFPLRSLAGLRLRLLPPMGLTSSRLLWLRENEDRLAAPLIGEQLRDFGAVPLPSGAWFSSRTVPPLGAVLEQMFTVQISQNVNDASGLLYAHA